MEQQQATLSPYILNQILTSINNNSIKDHIEALTNDYSLYEEMNNYPLLKDDKGNTLMDIVVSDDYEKKPLIYYNKELMKAILQACINRENDPQKNNLALEALLKSSPNESTPNVKDRLCADRGKSLRTLIQNFIKQEIQSSELMKTFEKIFVNILEHEKKLNENLRNQPQFIDNNQNDPEEEKLNQNENDLNNSYFDDADNDMALNLKETEQYYQNQAPDSQKPNNEQLQEFEQQYDNEEVKLNDNLKKKNNKKKNNSKFAQLLICGNKKKKDDKKR